MQFATLALFAASASAAAVMPRQVDPENIIGFKASCDGGNCEYAFGVTNDASLRYPNQCTLSVPGAETLPAVVAKDTCKVHNSDTINYAYTWSMATTPEGGLDFELWWPYDSRTNLTYCHEIKPTDLVTETNGDVKTQRYVGPTDFQMPFCPFKQH